MSQTPASQQTLTYALLINAAPYGNVQAMHAYQFAAAALESGHQISQVFFYQEGVAHASGLNLPANDEFNLTKAWQQLAAEHNIRLEVCVAASLRRGVVDDNEAKRHQVDGHNLAAGFEMAGLGGLAQSMLTQDRLVQF
ncbi:MAG: sulfurtransferase complex subunit TusD [Vibrio sp.]